ncbi:MAG: gfo/Idh/MocA family oxidoreductase [Candidatus Latescibacteria bacterium]|nr:gfo/Idh/MocA family oxidoreductase [Candidatus Latescibacterota bacterium]
MTKKLTWGIIGAGGIAGTFAENLAHAKWGTKGAVGSRSLAKAQAFAAQHGFAKAYGSYQDLLADAEIDAVYVATPHPLHREPVLAAAAAGKHILCEKPLGVTPAECEEMIAAAEKAGVVLLEAFMYRTHPQTQRLGEIVADGAIGDLRAIRSSFCYGLGSDYNVRIDPNLRGGGLYDVGCYCINFSRMLAGQEPDDIAAVWTLGAETGVDETLAVSLHFPSGLVALFDVGIRSAGSSQAELLGTQGSIFVPQPWKPAPDHAGFIVRRQGQPEEVIAVDQGGYIYALEADHLAQVVAGQAEPVIPAANAVGNAAVLDTIWQRIHG